MQEEHWPDKVCYGCGPSNAKGLHVRSFVVRDAVPRMDIATIEASSADGTAEVLYTECCFTPEPHHAALPGVLNGGIIASVFDCHCNITAAHCLMRIAGGSSLPHMTVTADLRVQFKAPTPMKPLRFCAVVRRDDIVAKSRRVVVHGYVHEDGVDPATAVKTSLFQGTFVALKERS
mgnify:CR=1 FL=1